MATEFTLPELGENIDSGDITKVLVAVGDTIAKDQAVIELETEKATVEVPSAVSGRVSAIHVKEGDTLKVGQVILTVEDGAGAKAEPRQVAPRQQPKPAAAPAPVATAKPAAVPAPPAAAGGQPAEFRLPELGENIESGDVTKVLVAVGDTIAKEQAVIELETEKATVEVPSAVAGRVSAIHVKPGEKVSVGQLILTVAGSVATTARAKLAQAPAAAQPPSPVSAAAPARPLSAEEDEDALEAIVASGARPAPSGLPAPAAPSVRRLARELGVEINAVKGSGPRGRISIEDVKAHVKAVMKSVAAGAAPAAAAPPLPDFSKWGEVERKKMTGIRRATARHLSHAWQAPHVTQHDKADLSGFAELQKKLGKKAEQAGGKLTLTAVALKVVAAALRVYPQFASSVDMARDEVVYKKYCHIGVAVDTDRGLLVPVIREADSKSLVELSVELGRLAEKARAGKLTLEEMHGGVFTITNLGGIGGTHFSPIVNAPEVAILGLSRSRPEPVWMDGKFEPRNLLPLSLSYDHRIIDGADAARFLRWVVEAIGQPSRLPLED